MKRKLDDLICMIISSGISSIIIKFLLNISYGRALLFSLIMYVIGILFIPWLTNIILKNIK